MNTGDVIKSNSLDCSAGALQFREGVDDPNASRPNELFFVISAHRLGTSLLRLMLHSHPRLYLSLE